MIETILIIEDSEAKLLSVSNTLHNLLPDVKVEVAKSVKSGINAVRRSDFDLIIADMSLPTFDVESREKGGTPRPFGGIEVFDNLQRLKKTIPIIVVTSYPILIDGNTSTSLPDLDVRLRSKYESIYKGYVYFDSAYSTWEQDLIKQIQKIENE